MKARLKRFVRTDFFKNVFTLVSATGIAQAISLAIYPVLTRIYTPEEHGLFSLYMSIIGITAIISTGKYELAVMIPKKEKDGAGLTLLSILLSGLFSLILGLFILIFFRFIPGWFGNDYLGKWLWFIPLSTFLVSIFQSLGYWFNRGKAYRTIAGGNLTQSIVNSAVKLSASKVMSDGGGLLTGAIAGQLIGALVYVWKLVRNGLHVFRSLSMNDILKLAKEHSFFPRFNMMLRMISKFSSSLPIFVFSRYFSADIVGFFGLGFMLINRPMNLLSNSFSSVFSQEVIAAHNGGNFISGKVRQFTWRMGYLAIIPFTIAAVFGPWLVTFIFGKEWFEAGVYLRIFTPWLFVVFLNAPLDFLADMLSRQRKAMWIEIIKFLFRIVSLLVGVVNENVYLALILFSGSSFLVVLYTLFWRLGLAKQADIQIERKNEQNKD
ncbi:lipopolysaccharide biosynthesis protein [Bacteroidota bacterium]